MTSPTRVKPGVPAMLALAALALAGLSGCTRLLDPPDSGSPPSQATAPAAGPAATGSPAFAGPVGGVAPSSPVVVELPAPGGGVLTGRLVDAVTGLPVRDAGIALLGRDRRTISGPDGRFRLDGVAPGPITLVFGPVQDYIARSMDTRIDEDGLDLGVTALLPASPPTLVMPEYGGVVVGCRDTQVQFATEALSEPVPVSVTCLIDEREFPAPAPAGRLPLAVVDLAPEDLQPAGSTRFQVALPPQPRYAAGVPLDLLRLDLDRLIWVPTSTLEVDEGGQTAGGDVTAFGTYMVAAPPFGTFMKGAGDGPVIQQFRVSAEPDGPPADVFPTGTVIVYASFEYAQMDNTPIEVRTVDTDGDVLFESARPYADSGRDNVPMVAEDGAWPPGRYVTTLYVGDPAAAVHSIRWRVAVAPTAVPPAPTLPAVPPGQQSASVPPSVPVRPPASACRPPRGWYAYVVQPGDTLYGLAARTGTSALSIMEANCLASSALFAGQVIYLPYPPAKVVPPVPPAYPTHPWVPKPPYPTAPRPTRPRPTRPRPTSEIPPTLPTTWYTPAPDWSPEPPTGPTRTPLPPKPSPLPATVAPRPTSPPTALPPPTMIPPSPVLPTAAPPPTAPPVAPSDPPLQPTTAPTPAWPTVVPTTEGLNPHHPPRALSARQ